MSNPINIATVLGFFFTTVALHPSLAQDFPNKPVRFVVGYPPAGIADLIPRVIAQELVKEWRSPVIVDNRPGGNGVVAAESVFRAPPDGYTILHTDNGAWFTNEFLRTTKPPYNLNKDFIPLVGTVLAYNILVARNGLGVGNARELISLLKRKGPSTSYFSLGVGGVHHVLMEDFLSRAGVQAVHVPYQGGIAALRALLGDEVDFGFTGISGTAGPAVLEGKIKGLGVTSEERSDFLPEVPTLSEAVGFPFVSRSWFVLLVHASTPEPIVDKLRRDIGRAMSSEEFQRKFLATNGQKAFSVSGDQLRDFIAADRKEFETRVVPLKIKLD